MTLMITDLDLGSDDDDGDEDDDSSSAEEPAAKKPKPTQHSEHWNLYSVFCK